MIWDFILRLFVAGILGAVIGLDREYRAKEAGYRTNILFCSSDSESILMMVAAEDPQDAVRKAIEISGKEHPSILFFPKAQITLPVR